MSSRVAVARRAWVAIAIATAGCPRQFPPVVTPLPDGGPHYPPGTPCSLNGECASNVCADTVCCQAACTPSESCDITGSVGVCTPRPAGTPCDAGSQCPSSTGENTCLDGVCCAAVCATDEVCNAAGSVGQCSPRPTGSPCDAGAACPTGSCADFLCCESACEGPCQSCNVPGLEGQCIAAAPNTSPRGQCGPCEGCFGGLCAPAVVDTDPGGTCDDDAGQACNQFQLCGVKGGQPCQTSTDCAGDQCFDGTCLRQTIFDIDQFPMNSAATNRYLSGLASDSSGDLAVAFTETTSGTSNGLFYEYENALFLAIIPPSGDIQVLELFDDLESTLTVLTGSVAFVGPEIHVATLDTTTSATGQCSELTPCGLYLQAMTLDGYFGRVESIDPTLTAPPQVQLATLPGQGLAGELVVALAPSGGLQASFRNPDGGWGAPLPLGTVPGLGASFAMAVTATTSVPLLVYLDATPAFQAIEFGPGGIGWSSSFPATPLCTGGGFPDAVYSGAPAGEGLAFALNCSDGSVAQLRVRPLADGGGEWGSDVPPAEPTGSPYPNLVVFNLPLGRSQFEPGTDEYFWGLTSSEIGGQAVFTELTWRAADAGWSWVESTALNGPQDIATQMAVASPAGYPNAAFTLEPTAQATATSDLLVVRYAP